MAYPTILVSSTSTKAAGNNYSGIDGTVSNPASGSPGVSPSNQEGAIAQSSNGRYVVFMSEATNFTAAGDVADTNGGRDIFLKDLVTGLIKRVSTDDNNDQFFNSGSDFYAPEISDDGRYVLFETEINIPESGLGAGNPVIYRKDVTTGDLQVVSVVDGDNVNGSEAHMSNYGRYVTFTSNGQVYLRDLQTSTTTLVSIDSDNTTIGDGNSSNGYISADNQFVVFESLASNFLAGNASEFKEIFMKNIQTGELTRISENAAGGGGTTDGLLDATNENASISGNGRYVVFESTAEDLVDLGGTSINSAIYRKDLVTGELELVSETKAGTLTAGLITASDATITDNGRFVLFRSGDIPGNPLSATGANYWHIKDMANGDIYGIDLARSKLFTGAGGFGVTTYQAPYQSYSATISGDGKYVTLASTQSLNVGSIPSVTAATLATGDNNDDQFDVFRIDVSSITSKAVTAQTRTGTTGADTLTGGAGADKLVGLAGDDIFNVEIMKSGTGATAIAVAKHTVTEALNQGNDTVALFGTVAGLTKAGTITLATHVENLDASGTGATLINLTGNTSANNLIGNDASNVLTGGTGIDTFAGGAGDDTYVLDQAVELDNITELENEGTDTIQVAYVNANKLAALEVSLALTNLSEVENVKVTGTGLFNITGNDLNNVLTGNASNNILDGGEGNDTLIGGTGNDTYILDSVDDVVTEAAKAGTDTVSADFNVTLSGQLINIENITLTGNSAINGIGNALVNVITGNGEANELSGLAGNDSLVGAAGEDTLDGGVGLDTMRGGADSDTYYVDNVGDRVIELLTEGTDTIISSITYSLVDTDGIGTLNTNGGNVENLNLTGTANINATGNALNNAINGNSGNNIIIGGAGVDTLDGGNGSDLYIVSALADKQAGNSEIVDSGITGIDELRFSSTVGNETLVVEATDTGLERVVIGTGVAVAAVTTGTIALNINANAAANGLTIIGNNGNNALDGTLFDDSIVGGAGLDNLIGYDGNDTLDGGTGIDNMQGGAGDDTYVVDNVADTVIEAASADIDTIKTSLATLNLSSGMYNNIENLSYTGSVKFTGTGTDDANVITGGKAGDSLVGGAGNDTLDGGLGNDTLVGGDDDDTYLVNSALDRIIETETGGTDIIKSSVTFSLIDTDGTGTLNTNGGNVENLELMGTANINATGNALDNEITGNSGKNIITGGLGEDELDGRDGSDLYIVNALAEKTVDDINDTGTGIADIDELRFTATSITGGSTLMIGAGDLGLERVVIGTGTAATAVTTGTAALNIDASAATYGLTIVGNNGINSLTGGAGNDSIIGGSGNDNLYGNDGNDTLDGGVGADYFEGGEGGDTYVIDNVGDAISEAGATGVDTIKTGLATFNLGTSISLDNIENLTYTGAVKFIGTGNSADNVITGGKTGDVLNGGLGNDTLDGALGNDTLIGGDNDDMLIGGLGNDSLTGDTGADTFVFNTVLNGTSNVDKITDFDADDFIQLDSTIFAALGVGDLSANNFKANAGVPTRTNVDTDDFIYYDTNTGNLYYDKDGSGSAAAVKFATLTGAPAITEADFVIVA